MNDKENSESNVCYDAAYAWFVWDNLDLCIRKPGIHVIWNTRDRHV